MESLDENSFDETDGSFNDSPTLGDFSMTDFLISDHVPSQESLEAKVPDNSILASDPDDKTCTEITEQCGASPWDITMDDLEKMLQAFREEENSQCPKVLPTPVAPVAMDLNLISDAVPPMDITLPASLLEEQAREQHPSGLTDDDPFLLVEYAAGLLKDQGPTEGTVRAGKQRAQSHWRNPPEAGQQKVAIRRRIRPEKWEEMRGFIEAFYKIQGNTLKDTKEFFETEFQFSASYV